MVELSKYSSVVYFAHQGQKFQSELPTNVMELPDINHVSNRGEFVFENGLIASVDVFLPCTGYVYDFSFLSKECEVHVKEDGKGVTSLYKHMIHTK